MILGGLSLDRVLPDRLPETFQALAVPSALLPDGRWPERFADVPAKIVTDPAEPQVFRIMPEESFRVRQSFQRQLERDLRELAAQALSLVVLSPDTDRIAAEPAFALPALAILRGARSVLPPGGMRLAVRLRLPHPGGAAAAETFFRLLQTVPGLRGWVELHPHEPAFAAWRPEWLGLLKMLSPAVEVVYSRHLGNRITPKLLSGWLALFDTFAGNVPVLFRPELADAASLAQEAAELEKMLGEWRNGNAR